MLLLCGASRICIAYLDALSTMSAVRWSFHHMNSSSFEWLRGNGSAGYLMRQ